MSHTVDSENSLACACPELAKEWHPTKNGDLTPVDITYGSKQIVWWKCENGHEWRASIDSRKRGRGCPECAKTKEQFIF